MERLTTDDDRLLRIEDQVSAVHGMTVGVFAGPQPAFDDIQDLVASRIPLVPRYRQRIVDVPFDLERPVWVDDPHFSLDFHIRNTALPERRDQDALSALVSRLLCQRLDRSKPLWELWVVSNLRDDHWALISKVHYAMIDGVSGTDLFGLLLDETPVTETSAEFNPPPLPKPAQLIPDAVVTRLFNPLESLQTSMALARLPLRTVRRSMRILRPRADEDGFRTRIGPNRRWERVQIDHDLYLKARDIHDSSTTDVILATITGGIRHYLLEQGRPVPKKLTALIPLAVASGETGFNHEIAATTTDLPIGLDDPVARLDSITAQNALSARNKGAITGDAFRRADQFSAPTVLALSVRAAMGQAHASSRIDTVAVNVPAPADPQHLMGRELLKAYPVIPLAGKVPMAIAALTYRDTVSFGITGDYDSTPGLEAVATGIRATLDDLLG